MNIAAFSTFCYDYYPEEDFAAPGGNSLNFAVHIKSLGAGRVSVAGNVGTDMPGDRIIELCKKAGLNYEYLIRREGVTASNRLYLTKEGERYSKSGDWINGVRDDGEFSTGTWEFLLSNQLLAVPYGDKRLDELLIRRKKEHFIIVDFLHFGEEEILSRYNPEVDISFVSPEPEYLDGIIQFARNSKNPVVLMLGKEGSRAFFQGKEYIQKAFIVDKVVDTTGCGDSYQAAFAYNYLKGRSVETCMLEGTKLATKTLLKMGAY